MRVFAGRKEGKKHLLPATMEREIPCLVVAKGLARKGLLERVYWQSFTGKGFRLVIGY